MRFGGSSCCAAFEVTGDRNVAKKPEQRKLTFTYVFVLRRLGQGKA